MIRKDIVYLPTLSTELGVSAGTLRYWRHAGIGPRSFKIGRRTAYRRGDVDSWLQQQERETARGGGAAQPTSPTRPRSDRRKGPTLRHV